MKITIEERFWSKVDVKGPDDCWEWQRAQWGGGYGSFGLRGKLVYAHRMAWELIHGCIPKGMQINHHCDNRLCCNPTHLYVGTQLDNVADRDRRGRRKPPKGELNGRAKLTRDDVRAIRVEHKTGEISYAALGRRYKIDPTHISAIVRRKSWKHIK